MNPFAIFLLFLLALALGGAVYQRLATRKDRQRFPPPGKMVDVGDHRLHLEVTGMGTGLPTVILEAGLGSFSSNWAWVKQELAEWTGVVAYDRAGLGWSDVGSPPRDAEHSARELETALQNAGIKPPYIVVGHSYGGLVMRAFANLYREQVSGMVLVDASHPDQWANIPPSRGGKLVALSNRLLSLLGQVGVLHLYNPETPLIQGLPPQQFAEMSALLAQPAPWKTGAETLAVWETMTRPQINGAQSLGAMPLMVLSVTEQAQYAEVLTRLQNDLPRLSTNSVHTIIQGATHDGLVCRQENARQVTAAIRRVVLAAHTSQPLNAV